MRNTLIVTHCAMCREAVTQPFSVVGNPERFCDLTCCRIFYSRPVTWIRKAREEARP